MIVAPKARNAHLASTWVAGICLAVLAVGLHGATYPLEPPVTMRMDFDTGDNVALEEFEPPPAGPAETKPEEQEEPIVEEVEIPPVPVLQAPLTPPEMTETTPVEQVQTPPPPSPVVKPPAPKPVPSKPKAAPRPTGVSSQTAGAGSGERNGSGQPTLFQGGGGRFPHPTYPSAARSAKQQGTVRLMVTVESSGLPGDVSVSSSSGFPLLDQAACDHVRRRWRWPTGDTRRYIVPVRFVLQ